MLKNQACAEPPAFSGFRQSQDGYYPFTMVPNQFFSEILPFEKPCVIKVICFILRRTVGWVDQNGQRKQQQQIAYSEFAREMDMSMQAVADGLKIALAKGYIVRTRPGGLHSGPTGTAEGAWYSLHWATSPEAERISNPTEPTETTSGLPLPMDRPVTAKQSYASKLQRNPAAATNKGLQEVVLEDTVLSGDAKTTLAEEPQVFTVQTEGEIVEIQSKSYSNKQIKKPQTVALKFRDMINKGESDSIKKVESKRKNNSTYIGNVISEIGQLFGDHQHRPSNIKQALNIWSATILEEGEFVKLLYKARDITRNFTSANLPKPKNSSKVSQQVFVEASARNRMPYFFRVLNDLVITRKDSPLTLPSRPAPEIPVNLAGKPLSSRDKACKVSATPQTPRKGLTGAQPIQPAPVEIQAANEEITSSNPPAAQEPVHEYNAVNLDPAKHEAEQAIIKNAVPDIPANFESPLSLLQLGQVPDEYASIRDGWARQVSVAPAAALNAWEQVIARTEGSELKAITRKMLGIEVSKVRPELLACLGRSTAHASSIAENVASPGSVEMVLVFRNSFDMRYASHHLTSLQGVIERVSQTTVTLYLACF